MRAEWDVLARLMPRSHVVASALAAVGVYGVVAFSAASRRASSASAWRWGERPMVRRQVLRGAAIIAAGGLVFGLAGAFRSV